MDTQIFTCSNICSSSMTSVAEERKTRTSCDLVRALPTQRVYSLLWFYLCGILRTNGDRSRQRKDSWRELVEEMRITILSVCQQSFPSSCDGTLAGFFHSTVQHYLLQNIHTVCSNKYTVLASWITFTGKSFFLHVTSLYYTEVMVWRRSG